MSKPALPRGLYAITDSTYIGDGKLANAVLHAIMGGAVMIQYRDKSRDSGRRKHEAAALRDVCHDHGALLIVNDDIRLAGEIEADGVHLGRDDRTVEAARRSLGDEFIIGASCYNSLGLARRARDEGADYVAFGSFFTSRTKASASRADIAIIAAAHAEMNLHIVAIGGITPENGGLLLRAGADMLAASAGVFDHRDPESAARHYDSLFRDADLTQQGPAA